MPTIPLAPLLRKLLDLQVDQEREDAADVNGPKCACAPRGRSPRRGCWPSFAFPGSHRPIFGITSSRSGSTAFTLRASRDGGGPLMARRARRLGAAMESDLLAPSAPGQ